MFLNFDELPPSNSGNKNKNKAKSKPKSQPQHQTPNSNKPNDSQPPTMVARGSPEHLTMLTKQADQGSETAITELRSLMSQRSELVGQLGGDLCRNIRHLLADTASCGKRAMREAVLVSQEHLKANFAGPNVSPLQQMLIERLLNCSLAMDTLDQEAALQQAHAPGKRHGLSADQDRAHRRFHEAVAALATLQRSQQPLQIELNLDRPMCAPKEAKNVIEGVETERLEV